MAAKQQKLPFWRRNKPLPKYNIALLRPAEMAKGKRFETLADARNESERSEKLLLSFSGGSSEIAEYLQECRDGYGNKGPTRSPAIRLFIARILLL